MNLFTKRWYLLKKSNGFLHVAYKEYFLGIFCISKNYTPRGLQFNTFDAFQRKEKVYGFLKIVDENKNDTPLVLHWDTLASK